ncbi:type II secretion system secretin GspD [Croceicoccus naphthovorans]|uniref:Type II secretion system protein D n=1 Tax=Croceicoccus naphthovorans TaxID=1348774 RepID=A0A0G3XJ87_9SPHN|nr:type II secretion system secretin GspD [Croceicoccus naphthovorans]AKM10664.1 type II secretion system protein D [Croceicoccus naphthovorans]MBB3988899.1 general secretion pathway protein D [Croceicoccus naphthovorans]
MKRITRSLQSALAAVAVVAMALPQVAMAQYVLNVRDADVRAFVADAAQVTGRTFIVDGRVNGKISVVTERPLTRSEYFEVFLATLRANGLVAVPIGNGAFRIQPAQNAASQPSRLGTAGAPDNAMVTEVVRLGSIEAAQAVETLRPLISPEGSITANQAGNSLVVVDYADNIRRIRALVRQIDRDTSSTELVTLNHAGAREIAAALSEIAPKAGGLAGVVAVDSSNSILLRGDRETLSKLAAMARDLDARAAEGSEIKVIWLDYADAAAMVPMLERLVGGSGGSVTPAASSTVTATTGGGEDANVGSGLNNAGDVGGGAIQLSGGRGTAIITRYPGANAIVISAPVDVQRRLAELVRQLDIRQDQVLVEAIIVEVSDSVAKELGVQFLIGGKDMPFAVTNFSNVAPNILDIAGGLLADATDQTTTVVSDGVVSSSTTSTVGDLLRENAATAVLGARGGYTGGYTSIGNDRYIGALINAIQADSDSNILSTPHITTNDNVPASILFGQEIPVSTGEALSGNFDNAFRTIQRQNVGIELDVTPQINASNEVRLDLRQEVSSIAGPVSSDFNELIINKREIKTTVTVGDREIIVLGGLLDDNERRTIQKIPLLGDIPVIGELFKSRGKSHAKTNLMVFIRPTILRTARDRQEVTARRYGIIRDAQRTFDPDREPSIDELVIDYLGAAPPQMPNRPDDVIITPESEAAQ